MADPRWLAKAEILEAHERQLAEHGGLSAGDLGEADLAAWLRARAVPLG